MNLRRFRPPQTAPVAPPAARGWMQGAYGQQADVLVGLLPGLMDEATTEASLPSTPPFGDGPTRPAHQRGLLWDDLKDLRALLLSVDVAEVDVDRDRRLRAALSSAIGAAGSLALASTSQPTGGYLTLTQAAVDEVLSAAGRRSLGWAG